MRLADDRRARVPFALVGVVVLVASTGFASVLATRDPAPAETGADAAATELQSSVRSALTVSVRRAGRAAARDPVLVPANTSSGRVINDSSPYTDALRVRIYLAAADALADQSARVGAVTATASLPAVTDAASLRAAKRRVHLRRPTPTDLAVRVENVTLTLRRGGRTVERVGYSPTVTVATPTLALHDRVRRFEARLDRTPLAGPGLGRRLSTRLYPVAWARGYAQYAGQPVANVVANRHVEIATNGGILAVQRDVFGRSDRRGRAAMVRATARVGAKDLLAASRLQGDRWLDAVGAGTGVPVPADAPRLATHSRTPAQPLHVGVNQTADRAFTRFVAGESDGPSLADVLTDVYAAEVRLVTTSDRVGRSVTDDSRPSAEWTLVETDRDRTSHVTSSDASAPSAPAGFHRLAGFTRRVVVERRTVRRWRSGNVTRTTERLVRETYRVRVAVVGRHARTEHAPGRSIDPVHERGGPLDGPNLADVEAAAVDRLVDRRGGPDAVARRVAAGTAGGESRTVAATRPPTLRDWVYANLAALRERVRNLSIEVRRDRALDANPYARLARAVRDRRSSLVDAPATYDGVAEKASVAARNAYLDAVVARLEHRADAVQSTGAGVDEALTRVGIEPDLTRIQPGSWGRSSVSDSPVVAVEGSPAYLSLAEVTPGRVAGVDETYHPLAARNHNLFTVPYGETADAVANAVVDRPPDRVALGTAARALRAANRTLAHDRNATLAGRRDRLQVATAAELAAVRPLLASTLATAAPELDAAERRSAVDAGFARWDTTHGRALAAANGSLAGAVAGEAVRRQSGGDAVDRDWLRVRLRVALRQFREELRVTVAEEPVADSVAASRSVARDALARQVESRLDRTGTRLRRRWLDGPLSSVPAGLPLTPVPGYWYATANVWRVQVRGGYARFVVRARGGSPAASPSGTVAYVRESGTVAVDVDDDGASERLGRTTPVAFETETAVVVVVPPGGTGVGDVDGDADERSAGWQE
ncbi:hypothetical protein ACFQH6_05175 [Halobacteriaceae archaeon GCM10025711]